MGTFGPIHWIILGAIVLLLFGGRGKLSSIMGDAAKGVRAFRDGLKGEEEKPQAEPAPPLPAPQSPAAASPASEREKEPVVR